MIRTTVALGVALTIGVPLTAGAQGFGSNTPPPYTPEPDARDLQAVLFNWTWHMGMLRGVDEHELVVSLEYQGNGTIQVDGESCTLTSYRASTNYQTLGQRIQYTCTLRNGDTHSDIEVVSGQYAWNEDIPGAELVPGEGKATPMPSAVQERLIRLWASPQGAPKAALAGAGLDLTAMETRNPGAVVAGGSDRVGSTAVSWEDDRPVVAYLIPGVPGAMAAATLDERYMAERVVVTQGETTTEFTYGNYDDWNNPLNKIELYYAGRTTERRNGDVVRDLTTVETETGSVYVVMPVPDSVRAAITPGAPPEPRVLFASDRTAELESQEPTPRLADGKPDLTGNWGSRGMNWRYGNRRCAPTQLEGCSPMWNQNVDFELEAPSRFGPNRPIYKPEHWDKVIALDMWTNREDPVMTCQPLGVPRQGSPRRIYHTPSDITFLYGAGTDGGGGYSEMRVIPTDGHQMHVVERFTRQGDEILYEVTVEDPEVLAEPWVMTPRVLQLNDSPNAGLLPERGTCEAYELEDIATQLRH
ncbi:MAG TPA: hypothetical protein VIM81_11390 [Gammaproteobacteria bacterium]